MGEIVKMIAAYGVLPVVLAAMIFVLLSLLKKMNAQEERWSEMLKSINTNTNPVHTAEEEDDNLRANMAINNLIAEMRENLGANRTSLYLFHNGGKDSTGRSFQKMSMTNEDVDHNTVSVIRECQNMQRMSVPFLLSQLKERGCYLVDDIDELKTEDQITYQMFLTRGTKSVYVKAIKETDGRMLGFITVEYTLNKRTVELQKLKDEIKEKTLRIGGVLLGSGVQPHPHDFKED